MGLDIIKTIGKEKKLKWEIVKTLSANNSGMDFGINPKSLAEKISNNGFDTSAIDVGHALKQLGFKERMNVGGRFYRKIYLKHLKKLEYQMLGDNEEAYEQIKPLIVFIYHNGYDITNKNLKKIHDKIAEPIRRKVGMWYCQSTKSEIEIYVKKCETEGLIPEDLVKIYGGDKNE